MSFHATFRRENGKKGPTNVWIWRKLGFGGATKIFIKRLGVHFKKKNKRRIVLKITKHKGVLTKKSFIWSDLNLFFLIWSDLVWSGLIWTDLIYKILSFIKYIRVRIVSDESDTIFSSDHFTWVSVGLYFFSGSLHFFFR